MKRMMANSLFAILAILSLKLEHKLCDARIRSYLRFKAKMSRKKSESISIYYGKLFFWPLRRKLDYLIKFSPKDFRVYLP